MTSEVQCATHGPRTAAYMCQHLPRGVERGFHWSGSQPESNWWPDAWCDDCDKVLAASGGEWNEEAEAYAGVTLVCTACYEEIRIRNWPRATWPEFDAFLARAITYLEERQTVLESEFGFGTFERYDWDQERRQLAFSSGGRPHIVSTIDFVGSISTVTDTWLWAWANQSNLPSVRAASEQVRDYGEQHMFMKLASPYWHGSEADGWEMTAVAAYLQKAQGAYRSRSETGFTFMILHDVTRVI